MKKMIFVILMCVAKMATAQEISPLVPYKTGKANHSIIEMEQKLQNNPSIVKNWGAVIERAAWRDGWAHEVSPEFFQEEKYILFCLRKSFQVKKNFKKGDFATFGTKSDGELASTERDPYAGELFLELDPNDLETESFRLSQDYPPFVYASSVCMNGVDVYARQVSSSDVSPTPRLNRNNNGYTQASPSEGNVRYAEPEFREPETDDGNTYITNNYYDQNEVSYDQDEYGYYEDPRVRWMISLNFGFGPLFGNSCCGYGGHGYGYCNHGYPYQQFGYQPAGGGAPQVTNVNIVNEIYNSNTNTNTNTNTATATTNSGNPPGNPGNPVDPPNGGGGGQPLDPPNGRNVGKNVLDNRNNYANHQPGGNNAQSSVSHSRATTPTKTEQSNPRPMKPSTEDSKPQPRNYFMRDSRQDQPQASQTPQSRPTTKQNQTQTNGYSQSRPQERSKYNQNPRGSNPQQARTSQPSSRPSYGNSSPSRQTAYNAGQSNRGGAPTGGRGNSGGGNYGGQRR